MPESFFFICYSRQDAKDLAITLADQLAAGPPSIPVWLDERKLQPGIDRDEQVVQALRDCQGILYLMTKDSADPNCPCKKEWIRGLKYKKSIIPLMFHTEAELPFQLEPREPINFAEAFDAGLARLRQHVHWRGTPQGMLNTMSERLKDALRDLADAQPAEKVRIEEEITHLRQEIESLRATINNPQAAQERTQKNIERGLERERQPELPVTAKVQTRFINRPPLLAPTYFQDRHVETGLIGTFLRRENMRLMTVVGRGGVGKTAMVCRLLRSLESGKLPDNGGELAVDGIVYLSARSGHPVNFPNLFSDLCKLLPEEAARYLEQVYKDPKQSCDMQMQTLLTKFPNGRVVVLLDNFEDVVDAETQAIKEGELDEALRAMLDAPPHGLKFILTTRVAPHALLRVQPGLQDSLELDQGLKAPYAENVLKEMDTGGTLGLREPDAPLAEAREATRGFPRALEAVVGILRTDRSTDLRGLLKELRQLGSKAEDVVRDLVGEAFNRLDPLAQEVMQALAVYGTPVPAVAVDYLLQPYGIGIDRSKTLARLVNMQFARGELGRFYLHQVDRDYALSRIVEGEPADRNANSPPLTRYALRHRAAEYFKETRKPREAWKTLDDLSPQLAEFALRITGEDYHAAANVLFEIDGNYLSLWGHYRLLVEHYEQLQGKLADLELERNCALGLGNSYAITGHFQKALRCFENTISLARTGNDKQSEASGLLGLGSCSASLGDQNKAIEYNERALRLYEDLDDKSGEADTRNNLANRYSDLGRSTDAIKQYERAIALHREIKDRKGECHDILNLASTYADLGENVKASTLAREARHTAHTIGYRLIETAAASLLADLMVREDRLKEAIKTYEGALAIADESKAVQMQALVRRNLARVFFLAGDLALAHTFAKDAAKYRFPNGYSSTLVLGGVIALCQKDTVAASKAFDMTLRETESQLASTAKTYRSAYADALALAGLTLSRDAALANKAVEAYRDARAVSAAPGLVIDELQILDALAVVADPSGALKPVRAALKAE